MGDASHLEKMGRELKCPICLGLLNSAVSLTCNHLFCSACIMKSMKTDATCPICKVPYHRREVRAAPHMDSLVSIYRSMEVASGVNILVTQNVPSFNKLSDEEKNVESDDVSDDVSEKTCWGAEKRQKFKGKGSRKTTETNVDAPGPIVLNSSSQTKKRVQVPHQASPEKSANSTKAIRVEKMKDHIEKSSAGLNQNPSPIQGQQQALSPFFWLRDVEEGKSLSQLAEDQLLDVTPPDVPSFSDLKDSDNESPSETKEHGDSDAMHMFDSEMFEWTQRPCSPDILPSPVKAKVQESDGLDPIQARISGAALDRSENRSLKGGSGRNRGPRLGTGESKKVFKNLSPSTNTGNGQTSSGNKRGRQTNENVRVKRGRRSEDHGSCIQTGLKKSQDFEKMGRRKRTCSKRLEGRSTGVLSPGAEFQGEGDEGQVHRLSDAQPEKLSLADNPRTKKRGRKSSANSLHPKESLKSQKVGTSSVSLPGGCLKAERKTSKDSEIQDFSSVSLKADNMGTSEPNESPSINAMTLNPNLPSNINRQSRRINKLKASSDCIRGDGSTSDGRVHGAHASMKGTKSTENTYSHTKKVLENLLTTEKPCLESSLPLRKCGTLANKFLCAFCHSSDELGAAGEMAHYYKGEPVSADYNGGSMVVHAHKICTEWAPNVYFEDIIAINLEAELRRSQRITCCCCGLKGAALGCYRKSCKKSFHFPCAKLVPECRWDPENFVMLCPFHTSSKLPCEETRAKEGKHKLTPKGQQLHPLCNQVAAKGDIKALQVGSLHGLSKKLVLCCSGLSVVEKNLVAEFTKLPAVAARRKWDSSVTHVIASTNENGACKRTLKVLMGILEGKWILSINWVEACLKNMKYIDEERYEITMDVHGIQDGPRFGRLRAVNKQPKLFDGFKFYFMGDFEPAYKGYLQKLVVAAGGTILHRRPISRQANEQITTSPVSSTLVIYCLELAVPDNVECSKNEVLSRRQRDAESLAESAGAKAASNSWVLNSIAASKVQALT